MLILLTGCMTTHAQGGAHKQKLVPPVKQIEVRGAAMPISRAYFVGEVHGIFEGNPFKFELIRWLYKNYGITDVAMEWGKSEAYLFNAYLQDGDTAIYRYYGHSEFVNEQLANWKALHDECPVTLHGIDFERTTFVPAVMSILEKSRNARLTKLYQYLDGISGKVSDIEDDRSGKKASIRIYNKAREIFVAEKGQLQHLLSTGFPVIEAILENPATQEEFKKRDERMALNLAGIQTKDSNGFLCIMGLGHTTLHQNSVMKRYIDQAHDSAAVLMSMVCKNCFSSSYFGNMVIPMTADYEGKNEAYMEANFDRYYRPGFYSLIDQHEFKGLPGGYNETATYFVLFKDQPEW